MSILFVGGTRSGKSELAEQWANARGTSPLFIATALPEDEETKNRIQMHKIRRGAQWQCLEAPHFAPKQLNKFHTDIILFDCLSMWLNNFMARGDDDADILAAVDDLGFWIEHLHIPIALVSSELGQGMVPMSRLARRYRDLHGLMNQRIAKSCQNVLLVSCGLPLALKGVIPEELK